MTTHCRAIEPSKPEHEPLVAKRTGMPDGLVGRAEVERVQQLGEYERREQHRAVDVGSHAGQEGRDEVVEREACAGHDGALPHDAELRAPVEDGLIGVAR